MYNFGRLDFPNQHVSYAENKKLIGMLNAVITL